MVLDRTLAIAVRRADGRVALDAVAIVIAVVAEVEVQTPGLPVPVQHAILLGVLHPQAVAVLLSRMVSVQDAIQQRGSGVIWEIPAPMPGQTSKTASIAESVIRGGIVTG